MDWSLNTEEEQWQTTARQLSMERFAPRAAGYDRQNVFPSENLEDLRREGFLALAVPPAYGGLWAGYTPYTLAALEIARGDASTMCILSMHFGCVFHLLSSGTPEQRQRYLSQVVAEGRFFGVATTDASSDVPGTRGEVMAEPCPEGWRLNGRRHFVTSAGAADWLIVRVQEPSGPGHTLVVAQKETRGIAVDRVGEGVGLRASSTYNVVFEDCFVPTQDRLPGGQPGEAGTYYPVAGFSLGLSSTVLGSAMAAYDWARDLLRQTAEKDGPSSVSQERRRLLAEMYVETEGARNLLLQAAWCADHQPANLKVAIQAARYACTRNAVEVTRKALLACGGRAYLDRYPLERYLRDALAGPLQAGCHETCPERMAAELLEF